MLVLRGPTKVDLLFPDRPRAWSDAWIVTAQTLEAVDRHFWDWILWLTQKRAGGHHDLVAKSLADMYRLLLQPVGATVEPRSIAEALTVYLSARGTRERAFGVHVSRELEREVLPTVRSNEAD